MRGFRAIENAGMESRKKLSAKVFYTLALITHRTPQKVSAMSHADYTRIRNMPLSNLSQLGAWELVRYIEASSKVQRQMILKALSSDNGKG